MYLMYVDESGDTGLSCASTNYFALSGIVVHESDWRNFIDDLLKFRQTLRSVYGLPIRSEIHASEFISRRVRSLPRGVQISRPMRLAMLRNSLDELAKLPYISITNVIVDKTTKPQGYDVFENAWKYLFQRFENTLTHGNFPGGHQQDFGFVITDATAGKKLSRLVRKMARFNYVPHQQQFGTGARNLTIRKLIEDPYGKDSKTTLPIQMADVTAYFLHQKHRPNSYIRRKHAVNYFDRLQPVLNLYARTSDPLGVVLV